MRTLKATVAGPVVRIAGYTPTCLYQFVTMNDSLIKHSLNTRPRV
jgi:hypothetical protein